jgi:Fe2+ or Zn2+ uptake regulation protein
MILILNFRFQVMNMQEFLSSPPTRLTRQRRLVWQVLNDAQEHLDAETIYRRANDRNPHISLATVYRSLGYLKDAGLIHELSLGENHNHYEITPSAPHEHFTCLGCGKVIELQTPQLHELASQVCWQQGLCIVQFDLHLSGYCKECAALETQTS